jgi:hypothetical protein
MYGLELSLPFWFPYFRFSWIDVDCTSLCYTVTTFCNVSAFILSRRSGSFADLRVCFPYDAVISELNKIALNVGLTKYKEL